MQSIVSSISEKTFKLSASKLNVDIDVISSVLDAALRNDVFYPAYVAFRDSFPKKPISRRNFYEKLAYQYITANTVWLNESTRVLQLFINNDLRVMPMKGFQLAHFYYPNTIMRFAWDTDLLFISEREKREAERLLLQQKFHLDYLAPLETKLTKRFSRFSVHIETHICPGSLMYAFELPKWNDLWLNCTRATLAGSTVDVMQPEDAFLVSCVSMCSRGMFTARDFLDLRQIIRTSEPFRWDIIVEICKKSIWRHIVLIPLHLVNLIAKTYLSESLVPEDVFQDIAIYADPNLTARLPAIASTIERTSLPVPYHDILHYIGYTNSPLFANFLLWGSENPTVTDRILRVFLEGFNILTSVRRQYDDRYALTCLRSWLSAYGPNFPKRMIPRNHT